MRKEVRDMYWSDRINWAREQADRFASDLEDVAESLGIEITVDEIEIAQNICCEVSRFSYPAEYKIAELLSSKDEEGRILDELRELLVKYRREFAETR